MNTAIILAAGKGTRMKKNINKQYLMLKDEPMIVKTIDVLETTPLIDEIIIVINKEEKEYFKKFILNQYTFKKISQVVDGGSQRQESVYNALLVVEEKTNIVLIHDGARPFVTHEMIERCIHGALEFDAASTGVPIKETIKIITKNQIVKDTPNRENIWVTQTPQAFKLDVIKSAHQYAIEQKITGTDDAMLVEQMGKKVKMVKGDYQNLKITTPEDLIIAETILNKKTT